MQSFKRYGHLKMEKGEKKSKYENFYFFPYSFVFNTFFFHSDGCVECSPDSLVSFIWAKNDLWGVKNHQNYYPNLKKMQVFHRSAWIGLFFSSEQYNASWLVYLSFHASYLRVSDIRIKLMQRNSHAKVTCILQIFTFDEQTVP